MHYSIIFAILITWVVILTVIVAYILLSYQHYRTRSADKFRNHVLHQRADVTFADVIGGGSAKADLERLVAFLQDSVEFQRMGAKPPVAWLISGRAGSGKSRLARAIAGEANVSLFIVSGVDFVEKYVGVGVSRVREMFQAAKAAAPSVLVIDDIEVIGGAKNNSTGAAIEYSHTLQQILYEIDNLGDSGVVVVATCGSNARLHPALVRPGRLNNEIQIGDFSETELESAFRFYMKSIPLAVDVDIKVIVERSRRLLGSEIEYLVNEAAMVAVDQDRKLVTMADFRAASERLFLQKIRNATPELAELINPPQRNARLDTYCAGKILVAHHLGKLTSNVRIVHGICLTEDMHKINAASNKGELEDAITIALSGRAAELFCGGKSALTKLVQRDLEFANGLARHCVEMLGLGESLLLDSVTEEWLAGSFEMTPEHTRRVEREVSAILSDCGDRAISIVREDARGLEMLRNLLPPVPLVFGDMINSVLTEGFVPESDWSRT